MICIVHLGAAAGAKKDDNDNSTTSQLPRGDEHRWYTPATGQGGVGTLEDMLGESGGPVSDFRPVRSGGARARCIGQYAHMRAAWRHDGSSASSTVVPVQPTWKATTGKWTVERMLLRIAAAFLTATTIPLHPQDI